LEIKNIILILVIGFIAFEVIEHLVMPIVFYCIRRKKKPFTGVESLQGEVVDVRQWEGKEGQVIIKGELWKAVSDVHLKKGNKAIVRHVEGLTLKIVPLGENIQQKQTGEKFQ